MADIARLRTLAAQGISRTAMADDIGVSLHALNRILRKHGITTHARFAGNPKPQKQIRLGHGIGKPPAKLMPSGDALGRVSIWGLGVYASIEKLSPKKSFANV